MFMAKAVFKGSIEIVSGKMKQYIEYFGINMTIILTLRLLMSYIYMEHLFLMFLDHTQRRTTVGRTPLDE